MRVQHNIPAMNSYRNYNNNAKAINKNLEKLSSGYRINRAGDDAAGLAISEKMRAQITGLEVAQKNAKDGISMVQTAEGALTEVHSMLNRMYALAEQAGNGTYDNTVDRTQLDKEVSKLRQEIDRIGKTTNFNGTKLFAGEQMDATLSINTLAGATIGSAVATDTSLNSQSITLTAVQTTTGIKALQLDAPSGYRFATSHGADEGVNIGDNGSRNNRVQLLDATGTISLTLVDVTDRTKSVSFELDMSAFAPTTSAATGTLTFSNIQSSAGTYTAPTENTAQGNAPTNVSLSAKGIDLWVGDFPDSNNKINVQLGQISSLSLGIDSLNVNLTSQAAALDSLSYIKDAIDYVSDMRGTLGAAQNRLEHTINNLSVMQENIQDAESTIRDTDVAEEMMKYTKNSILVQSAQAMLAQANQQPQSVLQLLQ